MLVARAESSGVSGAMIILWLVVGAQLGAISLWSLRWLVRWIVGRLCVGIEEREAFRRVDTPWYAIFLLTLLGAFGLRIALPSVLFLLALALACQSRLAIRIASTSAVQPASRSIGWLPFLFALSGVSALIYQVVWQRALFGAFGVNIESVTVIVSIFMLGLGLGALLGGVLSERFSGSLPIVFMVTELAIGAFGLASLFLIHWVGEALAAQSLPLVALGVFALLLVPTLMMGATLPVLVTYLNRHLEDVGRSVGVLYFANTLGSAVACFLTVDVLFAFMGMQSAVGLAATLNLSVGVMVYRYARVSGGAGSMA